MNTFPYGLFLDFPASRRSASHNLPVQSFRSLSCAPFPDDYYTKLIDWVGDRIYYTEHSSVITHNLATNEQQLVHTNSSYGICSIKCAAQLGTIIAGDAQGNLIILDLSKQIRKIRRCHTKRISALETFGHCVATGSKDSTSKLVDLRMNDVISTTKHHNNEVCGLAINRDHRYMCSGGNDNHVVVADLRRYTTPVMKAEKHKAAIRAISWSPLSSNKFITGGGTNDKSIKSWDLNYPEFLVESTCFESQICNVKWLSNNKVLSSFGYSDVDVKLLKNMKVEKTFGGHKNRVINVAVDTSEEYFATGSADKDIKLYRIEEESCENCFR